uniref:Small ribosomal subunit protein mS29 n=1 Tax=Corethrella appendiculata TaxID=1370023 RepID=U5ESZ8_9DIPT
MSTLAQQNVANVDDFRTIETNTINHTEDKLGRFYTISNEARKDLFTYGGIPKSYEKQTKTFREACLMVRQPAVEIIQHIKNTNFERPANRFVLYGKNGTGKSLALAHLIHFCYQQEFVIVHVKWVPDWFKKPKETSNSTTNEGCIDLPIDAASWLLHFKTQNAKILAKLNLKTTRDYVWTKRETTPADSSLFELIDHGINRVKFACDTIAALTAELKHHANSGNCKVMVAVDGYNAFFHPYTRILGDNKVKMTPDKITLTKPFLDLTMPDWKNGVCVLIVDKLTLKSDEEPEASELPLFLLGRTGFEHIDPFIPIRTDDYNAKEYESCINYYLDRKWIQNCESGFDKELEFLSGKNPFRLMELCKSL